MFICHASRQRLITRVAPPCWQMIGSWHLVIPRVYKNPCCGFRSHLMKTLDWSVETLGREWNSTELCIHLLKPLFHSSQKPTRKLAASAFKYCDWMKVLAASPILRRVEKGLYTLSSEENMTYIKSACYEPTSFICYRTRNSKF